MRPRTFYRSRLFWLGLPGLTFLLWVWGNSFAKWSMVGSMRDTRIGKVKIGLTGWHVWLQRGRFTYEGVSVDEPPAEMVSVRGPVSFFRQGGPYPDPPWGLKTKVSKLGKLPGSSLTVSLKQTTWWFPLSFVVVGYAGAWLGLLVMWQRRKARVIAASATIEQQPAL